MELRDLQRMTVVKLREEAMKHEGISGVHGMNKVELITALAPIFDIDLEAITTAAREKVVASKGGLKRDIREAKAQRDEALAAKDAEALQQARLRIKKNKRVLRRMANRAKTTTV